MVSNETWLLAPVLMSWVHTAMLAAFARPVHALQLLAHIVHFLTVYSACQAADQTVPVCK